MLGADTTQLRCAPPWHLSSNLLAPCTSLLCVFHAVCMAVPGVHVLLAFVCLYIQAVGHILHFVQQLWLLHCHGHFGGVCGRDLQGLARVG